MGFADLAPPSVFLWCFEGTVFGFPLSNCPEAHLFAVGIFFFFPLYLFVFLCFFCIIWLVTKICWKSAGILLKGRG